jgi:CTP:molybdopterin cytidylyltransferase MocA
MKLQIHRNMRDVLTVDATRVVVEDAFGNPIALALEFAPGQIIAATADNPQFNAILHNLGINKVVAIEDAKLTPLDQVRFGN